MTSPRRPTALIADDEPLLRDELAASWRRPGPSWKWSRRHATAAKRSSNSKPGDPMSAFSTCGCRPLGRGGRALAAARTSSRDRVRPVRAESLEQGVLDYLVKPVVPARRRHGGALERTAARRPARRGHRSAAVQLVAHLQQRGGSSPAAAAPLRWIRATVGQSLRLIAVDDIDFCARRKGTLITWRGDGGKPNEALIRTSLKELLAQLDPGHWRRSTAPSSSTCGRSAT
jgi:hypothetical protein